MQEYIEYSDTNQKMSLVQRLRSDRITLVIFISTLVITAALIAIGIIVPMMGEGYKSVKADGSAKTISVTEIGSDFNSYSFVKFEPKQYGKYTIKAKGAYYDAVSVAIYFKSGNTYTRYLLSAEARNGNVAIIEATLASREYYICVFGNSSSNSAEVWVESN